MKYQPPIGATDPDATYIDGNASTGTEGSPVPAAAIEHPMREIENAIKGAGLDPDGNVFTQLLTAIRKGGRDQRTFNANDYAPLPGGLIIQWGSRQDTVVDGVNYFPVAFPNSVLIILATSKFDNGTVAVYDFSKTHFSHSQLHGGANGGGPMNWFAIGY